jgi:hypothetical protein
MYPCPNLMIYLLQNSMYNNTKGAPSKPSKGGPNWGPCVTTKKVILKGVLYTTTTGTLFTAPMDIMSSLVNINGSLLC